MPGTLVAGLGVAVVGVIRMGALVLKKMSEMVRRTYGVATPEMFNSFCRASGSLS